jgi:hypothetical protein
VDEVDLLGVTGLVMLVQDPFASRGGRGPCPRRGEGGRPAGLVS